MKILVMIMLFSLSLGNIQALDLDRFPKSNKDKAIDMVSDRYGASPYLLNYIYDLTEDIKPLPNTTINNFYLICGLIYVESKFDVYALSEKKAYGLCQIRAINQKDINKRYNLQLDRYDIKDNIKIALLNIKFWSEYYDSLETALMFYNAGSNTNNGYVYYKAIKRQVNKFGGTIWRKES